MKTDTDTEPPYPAPDRCYWSYERGRWVLHSAGDECRRAEDNHYRMTGEAWLWP